MLYFFLGRSKGKQKPTQLNMRAQSNEKKMDSSSDEERASTARNVSKYEKLAEAPLKLSHNSQKQNTAIFFVYNGHEWEAYEVLGLPRGSTLAITTTHYQHLIKTSDPSTFEFFEAAYSAILKTKS